MSSPTTTTPNADAGAAAPLTRSPRSLSGIFQIGGLFLAILGIGILFALLNGQFAQTSNMLELLRAMSSLAIVAIGLTFVIIAGELDLSVGAVYGFCAMLVGTLWVDGLPLYLALPAGILAGAAVGAINAALTVFAGIPSFIVTLGTLSFFQGLTLFISDSQAVSPEFVEKPVSDGELSVFKALGSSVLPFDIPVQVLWLLGVAILAAILLHRSLFGFRLLAIGGNSEAARIARLPVRRYVFVAMMISGSLAALAGILDFSFLGSTDPRAGNSLTFSVFAAVIIGGASLNGGRGTIPGTLLGALLLAMLTNGLGLLGVGPYIQLMFVGAVTIAAVGIDRLGTRGAS
jgi:ribose/xylose/arabinose/galactoside ABC-type transport system permease subunit